LWSRGSLIGSVEVRATTAQDYSFAVPANLLGDVDVVFTNKAVIGWEDRYLVVNSVTVNTARLTAVSAGVTYDIGEGAAAFDGVNVMVGTSFLFASGALRFPVPRQAFASSGSPGVYVDQLNGNDSNVGTFDYPWKTLAAVANVRLAAGDGVYLRCGQVWRQSLSLSWWQLQSGATIAGYGDCTTAKAVISGADDFSNGWTKSGNVWSRAVPAGTPKIARVFVDGNAARTAQWPNGGDSAHGFALVRPVTAPTTVGIRLTETDAAAVQGQELIGASAMVRSLPWSIEKVAIGAYDQPAGVMYLSAAAQAAIRAGDGFVLQDKLWMLDAPGEFYHDTVNNRLYVYPTDTGAQANLNGHSVEGSVRDVPLTLREQANLVLSNLGLQKGRVAGLSATDTPSISIDRIDASGNAGTGIALYQWQTLAATVAGPSVTNSTIDNNVTYGINASYVSKVQIVANSVTRTGTVATAAGSSSAIAAGPGAKVDANVVNGSGYHGIVFSGTAGTQITRNTVSNYCLRLTDCGAIYSWNGPKGAINTVNQSSLVEGNQIGASSPNLEGTAGGGHDTIAGVYLDDYSRGVTVRGNVVTGAPNGVFVHNGSNIVVDANNVWLATRSGISASMDQYDGDYMTGNVYSNNHIVPISTASGTLPDLPTLTATRAISFYHHLQGANAIRSGQNQFRQNRIYRLNGTNVDAYTTIGSSTGIQELTVAEWMALNPQEAAPLSPATFATFATTLGNELVGTLQVGQGAGAWGAYFNPQGGGNVHAGVAAEGCTTNCLVMTIGSGGDLVYSPALSMTPNVLHVYSFRATPNGTATVGQPYISRAGTPWDPLGTGYRSTSSRSGTAASPIRYEAFFLPTSSAPARVNLQIETPNVPVAFESVSIKPVTGLSFSQPAEWAGAAFAPYGESRVIACSDLGWSNGCQAVGLDGVAIPMPRTLAAGTHQIFLRADSTWRR